MKSVDEQFAALPCAKRDLAFPDAFSGNMTLAVNDGDLKGVEDVLRYLEYGLRRR